MPSAATLNTALCDICRGGLRSPRPGPKWAAHYVSSLVRRLCLRPWWAHGGPMVGPWWAHGGPMVGPW